VPFRLRKGGSSVWARMGEFDAFVTSKLDRAYRDMLDAVGTTREMIAAGKSVHFIDMGLDTSTSAGELAMNIMASMAQFERRRIGERTKEALAVVRASGKKIGPAPFGYRNAVEVGVDGTRTRVGEWDEASVEMAVVGRIRELRRFLGDRRGALSEIAFTLNREGYRTRRGAQWTHTQVMRVIERLKEAV
jgi:DNA invertase Pin-like site-specific DNA recombinase